MKSVWRDLGFSVRLITKSPLFAIIVAVTLAIGIGATLFVCTIVNSIFLRPLAAPHSEELVVFTFNPDANAATTFNFSYLDFSDVSKELDSKVEMFAYQVGIDGFSLSRDGAGEQRADRILTSYVSGNYFTALDLKPAMGRLILPSEGDVRGFDSVVVLGYSYWKGKLNGDPKILNRRVLIDGRACTVIGVAPKGFSGLYGITEMQAYLPLNMVAIENLTDASWSNRISRNLNVAGRLRPGVSLAQVQANLPVIASHLSQQFPLSDPSVSMHVYSEREQRLQANPTPGRFNTQMIVAGLFFALSLLVLVLASINVANMLLVRAIAREHEMAIRVALGAGRGRLVRQLLIESLLLAMLGGIGGIVLSQLAGNAFSKIRLPISVPLHLDFGFDLRVFVMGLVAVTFTGIIVGLVPALRVARVNVLSQLQEVGRGHSSRRQRLRSLLVISQVAGSLVLLIIAGLLTRSLRQAQTLHLGFAADHVLNLSMDPCQVGCDEARGRGFYKDLLQNVRGLPGVESASLAFAVPMSPYRSAAAVTAEGHLPGPGQEAPIIFSNMVSTDYFKTMKIPVVQGRVFTDADEATSVQVATINETMASTFWPGEDPIGRRFKADNSGWIQVIGVVKDSKYGSVLEKPNPYYFRPLSQQYLSFQTLQVRTRSEPLSMAPAVEREIRKLNALLPVVDVETMDSALNGLGGFFIFKLGAVLAWLLGSLGLILAVVGVYSVASYAAVQQTFDIGVRMALGAQRLEILKVVLRQGFTVVTIGVFVGCLLALVVTNGMARVLLGVSTHDPLTYSGTAILLMVIALAACYIPARRAMMVDPVVALHRG